MTTILLVEDDPMNRDVVARYLRLRGYTVFTAADGNEAVAQALAQRPQLILMDMGLPLLSGWEAVPRIKGHLLSSHIPIIALTAYAMADERARSFEVGCDDYATKPVDFTLLEQKIQSLLTP